MTVHINGSKGKELYYNGVKIKEAYYNGNKVYSSGPLYYCYKGNAIYVYVYFYTSVDYNDNIPIGTPTKEAEDPTKPATASSQLTVNSTFQSEGYGYERYPAGDLYT